MINIIILIIWGLSGLVVSYFITTSFIKDCKETSDNGLVYLFASLISLLLIVVGPIVLIGFILVKLFELINKKSIK